MLPIVIIVAREAMRAVPASIREGSLALGATQWQTIRRQVLPASIPGIATGSILALSRAIGETAPLSWSARATVVALQPAPARRRSRRCRPDLQLDRTARRQEFKPLAAAAIIVLLVHTAAR